MILKAETSQFDSFRSKIIGKNEPKPKPMAKRWFSAISNETSLILEINPKTHKSEELKIFRGQMIGRVKLSTRPFILSFEWAVEDLNHPFNEKLNILLLTPSNKKNAFLRIGFAEYHSF